ncbi:MAG: 50S ribosomal protein L23 [Candidatus Gracilibacteria bacterium]|jgi:large subunit ribosomal protein L23
MKLFSPIKKSCSTEKSSILQGKKQYTFIVDKRSTKTEVKNAIRDIYGAKATKVRMIILPSKLRMLNRGKAFTKRPLTKKAIVTIEGKAIDPNKLTEVKKK